VPKVETPPEPPKPMVEEPPAPLVKPDIVEKSPKKIEPPKKKEKELQPPPKKETRPPPVDDFIRREAMKEDMTRQAQKDDISRVLAQENHASGQRASAEWSGRVAALVRAKVPVSIANAVPGNPTAEFEVSVLPGGVVGLVKLVKSSGYPAYDEAAARAVEATSPLPPTTGGLEMPRSFTLKARPKEQ
jgi:colicin import membrane protein